MMNVDHLPPLLNLSHVAKEIGARVGRVRGLVHLSRSRIISGRDPRR
jgi:hypothetical protein